jgi:hypothetical protein
MKLKLTQLIIILVLLSLTACAPDPETIAATVTAELHQAVSGTLAAWPTNTAYPTFTPVPTYTPLPTYTPYPTQTPRPTLAPLTILVTNTPTPMPVQFLNLTGNGDIVSDNYEWQFCQKAVFSWQATARDNLIVHLNKTDADQSRMLINEIGPTEGQVLQPLSGGVYFLSIRGPAAGWTITAECKD